MIILIIIIIIYLISDFLRRGGKITLITDFSRDNNFVNTDISWWRYSLYLLANEKQEMIQLIFTTNYNGRGRTITDF